MNIILITFAIKYNGDWNQIFRALETKEKLNEEEIKLAKKEVGNSKYKIITILDEDYPDEFKSIYKPPFCVWINGDLKDFKDKSFCLAGNQVDRFALKRIENMIPQIEKKYSILIPDFSGVDQIAIEKTSTSILYVLASGINKCNFINNKDIFISEYSPGTYPIKAHFKNRNRLIAAYADSLLLFTSQKNWKINSLISEFLNLGKEIFAFPGDGEENDGNSELIKQGANLVTSIEDLN